jgi:hypothetical protein
MIQSLALHSASPLNISHSDFLNLQSLLSNDLNGNLQNMSDYEELLMVEQLQKHIETLKGSISKFEEN